MTSIIPSILPSIFPSIEGSILSAFGAPSLLLDFARNAYSMGAIGSVPSDRTFSSLITFSRASGGGRINAAGEFEWVGNDVPRLTYDPVTLQPLGLLIEERRTNLLLQSASGDASLFFPIGSGVTKGAGAVGTGIYGGSSRAGSVAKNAITGRGQQNASVAAATQYTASIFVRKPPSFNGEYCAFGDFAESEGLAVFNPFSGVISATQANVIASTITDFGDFWRITVTRSLTGTIFGVAFFPFFNTTGTAMEGSGIGSGYAHLVDGVQLELGSFAASVIPTTTAQVTRAADVCSVNTLSPWFNATEGTLVVEYIASQLSNTPCPLGHQAGGPAGFNVQSSGNARHWNGTTNIVSGTSVIGRNKSAMAYAGTASRSLSTNGSAMVTDMTTKGVLDVIRIGSSGAGAQYINGIVESVTYHPRVIDVQQASA